MVPLAFAYHRALAPMLLVFMALAALELLVVHILVSIWSVPIALMLTALTVASMIWLALLIRSFRRLPVLLDEHRLLMRSGSLLSLPVELAQVEAVRGHFPSEALKSRSVMNLAMLSYPNVLVDLREPVRRGRRSIGHIAHRLDDPSGFIAALNAQLGRSGGDR